MESTWATVFQPVMPLSSKASSINLRLLTALGTARSYVPSLRLCAVDAPVFAANALRLRGGDLDLRSLLLDLERLGLDFGATSTLWARLAFLILRDHAYL